MYLINNIVAFLFPVVSIFFSEVDYSLAPEDAQNLTAVVVREIAIATPITVFVYPLNNTFANRSRIAPPVMFKGEPLQLSEETLIPPDDLARPTVATSESIIINYHHIQHIHSSVQHCMILYDLLSRAAAWGK